MRLSHRNRSCSTQYPCSSSASSVDEGRVASVHFEGTQEPWEPEGSLYHIITHDAKFYLVHIWKEGGEWNEAIHVLPQGQIESLRMIEPGTNASTGSLPR